MAIYMKVEGIDGHVTAKGYEKWIELDSLKHTNERNITAKPGNVSDRESTKPTLSGFDISKASDKTTPHVYIESLVGKAKKVDIHICQTGTDKITPYLQYVLHDCLFSKFELEIENKAQSEGPKEKITLSFDKIEMKYTPHDQKHNTGSPIPVGYDLATATKI
jgi:type VI secretion system secreted protein Hcp